MCVMTGGRRWLLTVLAATCAGFAAMCSAGISPASADFQYVAGQEAAGPTDGVCPGIGILGQAGYYRNQAGREPRADETFYTEIKLTYFESFDCAAAFTGITITLPAGLTLDTTVANGPRVVCQRFNLSTGGPDPRITSNCPSNPAPLNGSTYVLDPAATNFPERSAFGRNFWFQGYDGAQTYRVMRLLIPVKAAGALSAANVTFQMKRFDAATPWTSSVPVTTTGLAPPNGGAFTAPTLSVQNAPGQFFVSPIGVEVPFTVTKGSASYGVSEKLVLGSCAQNPCASAAYTHPTNPGCTEGATADNAFSTDESFLDVFGDFGDQYAISPPCDLKPSTAFTVELCIGYRNLSNVLFADCRQTPFTTPAVDVAVTVAESGSTSVGATFTPNLRGAWPAGTARVLLTKPGQSEIQISSQVVGARGTGALALTGVTRNDLVSWQQHSYRACYTPTGQGEVCGPQQTVVPGALTVPSSAATTATTATVSGVALRTPAPALTLQLRARKASEVTTQDPSTLPVVGSQAIAAVAGAGTLTAPDLVGTGLAAETKYAWTVCVETDSDAAPEECSAGASFTTAQAPTTTTPTTTTPGTTTPGTTTGPTTATPTTTPPPTTDTTKPKVTLKVTGKLRRRAKVTLKVTASDASGIKRVTIKVGKAKAKAVRTLKVTLPRKKGKLVIVIVVTDKAGNRTTLRRTLVVK